MQKAIIYTTVTRKNIKHIIPRLYPLYKTAKHHNLKILKYYFEKPDSQKSFSKLLIYLKKHKDLKHIIINADENIITDNSLFFIFLQFNRNIYIVDKKQTMVVSTRNDIN